MIRIEVAELDDLVDALERLLEAYEGGLADTLARIHRPQIERRLGGAPVDTGRLL